MSSTKKVSMYRKDTTKHQKTRRKKMLKKFKEWYMKSPSQAHLIIFLGILSVFLILINFSSLELIDKQDEQMQNNIQSLENERIFGFQEGRLVFTKCWDEPLLNADAEIRFYCEQAINFHLNKTLEQYLDEVNK